jgi:hypothetical protein
MLRFPLQIVEEIRAVLNGAGVNLVDVGLFSTACVFPPCMVQWTSQCGPSWKPSTFSPQNHDGHSETVEYQLFHKSKTGVSLLLVWSSDTDVMTDNVCMLPICPIMSH